MGAGGAGRKIFTWTGDVDEFWPSSKKPGEEEAGPSGAKRMHG